MPHAQHHLGRIYEEGKRVPKSSSEALRWYRSAADQGLLESVRTIDYESFVWVELTAENFQELVDRVTRSFDDFNYAAALAETESFFWTHFTDTYLELAKPRAWDGEEPRARGSAVAALRLGLSVLLRLFAPALPYIAEETWSWAFAEETGEATIHRAPWPGAGDFEGIAPPDGAQSFDLAVACHAAIHKAKADAAVSMGREAESLVLVANAATLEAVKPVLGDVLAATRCRAHRLEASAELEDGAFAVRDAVFAERS